jgi:hypothetical protein
VGWAKRPQPSRQEGLIKNLRPLLLRRAADEIHCFRCNHPYHMPGNRV